MMAYRVGILTLSDKGAQGLREDRSGARIAEIMKAAGYEIAFAELLPDDLERIKAFLTEKCDGNACDLLLTTGGTGFSERDVTPEATCAAMERNVPGIAEAMRAASLKITPRAMLSRGVSGIRKKTLIVNLPGSVRAVEENLDAALPAFQHGLGILSGKEGECG